jgi:hypothetical protein
MNAFMKQMMKNVSKDTNLIIWSKEIQNVFGMNATKVLLLVKIYINIRLTNTIEVTAIGVIGSNVAKDSVKSQCNKIY